MGKLPIPIALLILDGWGVGERVAHNAIYRAATPHMTLLQNIYPYTELICSGEAVGLPAGQMGNSEVGHLNIGSGRIVYQEFTRISKAIREGDFFRNSVLNETMQQTQAAGGILHLMGLLSDGGVHSHIQHLFALLLMAKQQGVSEVYVHAFLDGRDVPPTGAACYITALEEKMRELGIGRIASVAGRYYAMDRDKRWDRVEKAYNVIVRREGLVATSALNGLKEAYTRGETDEFVSPFIVTDAAMRGLQANDGVIFFNFRPDRARQLTSALTVKAFDGFVVKEGLSPLHFTTMTQYDENFNLPQVFTPHYLKQTLGEVFSSQGLQQLRIAETEKYAHVTFFFNGGEEKPYLGEDRILIPSPKVATYDLRPAMSANEVTEAAVMAIKTGKYDLVVLNFANCDMVGHTGKLEATMEAVKTVDTCIGRIVAAMRSRGGITCITADHGNAEVMMEPGTNKPFTAHTTNPVPFIIVSEAHRGVCLRRGILADIAPTILELGKIDQPEVMTGTSLLDSDCGNE